MKIYKKDLKEYKHLLLLALYPLTLLIFLYTEKTTVPKYNIHSFLDDKIPFIKEFVIFYCIWYFYLAAGFLVLGFVSRKEFYRFNTFIVGGSLFTYMIYILFPNGQDLRPAVTGTDIFSNLIKGLYSIDTPTNVCPSLHVFQAIGVHIGFLKGGLFNNRRWLGLTSFITLVLITASTVFIKQHSIIDVFCAIILAAAFYVCIYVIPEAVKVKKKWSEA